jgi:nicotinamidase-related amidase
VAMSTPMNPKKALILVDVQYDFLPGGSLAIANSNEIVPVIHRLLDKHDQYTMIVATKVSSAERFIVIVSRKANYTPIIGL